MNSFRRYWVLSLVGVLAGLLTTAGCGGSGVRTRAATQSTDVDLARKYGACDQDPASIDFAPARESLAQATRWLRLGTNAVPALEAVTTRASSVYVDIPASAVTKGTADAAESVVKVELHASAIDGLRWGLDNGASVYLILGTGGLSDYARPLVLTAAGDVIFPGVCAYDAMWRPLHDVFGDADFASTMGGAVGTSGDTLKAVLGIADAKTPTSGPTILNPATAPKALLDSLTLASVVLKYPEEWAKSDLALCSHIDEGWGDCVLLADWDAQGRTLGVYLNKSGTVEIWLVNHAADVRSPIQLLGTFVVPDSSISTAGIAYAVTLSGDLLASSNHVTSPVVAGESTAPAPAP